MTELDDLRAERDDLDERIAEFGSPDTEDRYDDLMALLDRSDEVELLLWGAERRER